MNHNGRERSKIIPVNSLTSFKSYSLKHRKSILDSSHCICSLENFAEPLAVEHLWAVIFASVLHADYYHTRGIPESHKCSALD